jgi:alkylated DNA repair protein (DNA oxidative demethylase)
MQHSLFDTTEPRFAPGALLLRNFAHAEQLELLAAIEAIAAKAPFRQMVTPGGFTMSVAMTNCGAAGWITDRTGYRYSPTDPLTEKPWPAMPPLFSQLANRAAAAAGYADFDPDACLINRYLPGTRMSLHQDRQEKALDAPVVSLSLGLSATFLWGGDARAGRPQRIPLHHTDAVIWGGPSRLNFHGIAPLKSGTHPLLGEKRYNMTFRRH